ncbi:uncharacterized protein LOC122398958 [Colletes gigas]|uniref:uncharacterized protein LOC122398958 n=1 Tax=Colletes gigas TaxID=935657 RepID=UPI001C9B01AB|nr:uncharacterized protein LOC122398958 [Colletes gigas]
MANANKRQAIRRFASTVNLFHRKWSIRRTREKNDYYLDLWNVNIIFFGDNDAFEKLLVAETPFEWNSREHFIVLTIWNDSLAKLNDRKPLIDGTLRKLWLERRIQNVFANEPLSDDKNRDIYSYNPFAVINETAWGKLEAVNATSKRHMLHLLSTLTYRRTLNFNRYKFNVSIFDQIQEASKIQGKVDPNSIYSYSGGYNGTSGILLGVIAKKLNFTINVVEPKTEERYGHLMKNGTISGALGDVVYRRVVASFATFFVKKYVNDMSGVEFTTTVGFDKICVVTPKAATIPKGFRIYYIFESSLWLCMLLSHIIVCLAWYYVQVFTPRRAKKADIKSTAFHMFLASAGCPIPLPNSSAERRLLAGVFFSSVTLIGIFNGALYDCFAKDMFYKDIDNMEELEASGLPIGFFSYSVRDVFGSENDPDLSPVLRKLRDRMIYAPNNIEETAFHRNISGLLRDQYCPLIKESLIDKTGAHMLHSVKECPAQFSLACLLPSNSIFRERINAIIGKLNQAGLPTQWRIHSIREIAVKMKVNIDGHHWHSKHGFVPFQLNDVQVCFFVLGTGLLSSIIVFFNEKGWLSFGKSRRKTDFTVE